MHNRGLWPAVLAFVVVLAGCNQAPPPPVPVAHDADVKAISDLETSWNHAFTTKSVDKIGAAYADDASVFMPDSPVLNGVMAIKSALKPIVEDKNFSLSFASNKVEVADSGDLAYSQGTYTMTMTAPKTRKVLTEKGKYVTVYKKQIDGGWKVAADIMNEDAPPKLEK